MESWRALENLGIRQLLACESWWNFVNADAMNGMEGECAENLAEAYQVQHMLEWQD